MQSWSEIAALAARKILTIWGSYLAGKAVIGADPASIETFVGAGMVFFGILWSVMEKYGTIRIDATLAKQKGLLVLAIMVIGLLTLSQASAADMPPPRKAMAAAPAAAPWGGGFYFGINGAGAADIGRFSADPLPGVGNVRPVGAMAGLTLGVGAFANGVYVGAEVDGDYDFAKATASCGFAAIDCRMSSGWMLTQRLLIGATMPDLTATNSQQFSASQRAVNQRSVSAPVQWPVAIDVPATVSVATAMPYLTVGVAERRAPICVDALCNKDWLIGWVAGVGVKAPVSATASFDFSYLYVNWNQHVQPAPLVDFKATSEHVLKAGLQFHL